MKTVSFETDLHDTYWLVFHLMFKLKKYLQFKLILFLPFHLHFAALEFY